MILFEKYGEILFEEIKKSSDKLLQIKNNNLKLWINLGTQGECLQDLFEEKEAEEFNYILKLYLELMDVIKKFMEQLDDRCFKENKKFSRVRIKIEEIEGILKGINYEKTDL